MTQQSHLMPLLQGWLRRAVQHPEMDRLVLRGSLLTSSLCPPGRTPMDLDFLVLGDFDQEWMATFVLETLTFPDPHTHLEFVEARVIWEDTPFPGLRVFLKGHVPGEEEQTFQIDFAFGDPLVHPPVRVRIPEVGEVPACTPETLYAWKVHGLAEFGRGRWRAKDLYDLCVLGRLDLKPHLLSQALPVAFTSRGDRLEMLLDFLERESWGCSVSGQRKWRTFLKRSGVQQDFLEARAAVRQVLSRLEVFHA